MAYVTDYTTGTIAIAANGTTVTGTGTAWNTQGFQAGDEMLINNLVAVIASINSNTSITITRPWTGGAITGAAYRIRYMPDGSRLTASVQSLLDRLNNGVLDALATVGSAADKFIYYTGTGVAALGNMIAGTSMFRVAHIPHMNGVDTQGYVRICNDLSDSSILGSMRLYGTGEFAYWFNEAVKWRIETDGRLGAGIVPANRVENMLTGGDASPYMQINGRNDGDQQTGMSIRISASQSFYLALDDENIWNVNTAGELTIGIVPADKIEGGTSLVLGTANTLISPSTTDVDGMTYSNNSSLRVANDGISLELQRRVSDGQIATFYRGTTAVGSISVSGSATTYNTSSDYRLKDKITPLVEFDIDVSTLDPVLSRIMRMKPSAFEFKSEPGVLVHGFIAHELREIVPYAVTGEKDGIEDYGNATIPERKLTDETILPERLVSAEYKDDETGKVTPAVYEPGGVEPATFRAAETFENVTRAEALKMGDDVKWVKTGSRPVYQSLDNSKLTADLVAAIQVLTLQIEELKANANK